MQLQRKRNLKKNKFMISLEYFYLTKITVVKKKKKIITYVNKTYVKKENNYFCILRYMM